MQLEDCKIEDRLPLQYNYIDEISGDDGTNEFVYLYQEPTKHFVYNLSNDKATKLNLDVSAIDFSINGNITRKHYLGSFTCGEVFDLEGILCGGQISPAHIPLDIRYEHSEKGLITRDNIRPLFHGLEILELPASQPYRYITHSVKGLAPRAISFLIDFPEGNTVYDREVKMWISGAIHDALWCPDLFVPISDNSPEEMVDFYARDFFFTDSITSADEYSLFSIGSPVFEFLRQWESDSYATYRFSHYLNGSEHKYGPVAQFVTFDKKTGEVMDFNHIFMKNRNREIIDSIESQLKEDLWIWYYDSGDSEYGIAENIMELAKEDADRCLKDIQDDQMENPEEGWSFRDVNVSLPPDGVMLDIGGSIKGNAVVHIYPVIPYGKLKPYLEIPPMEGDVSDLLFESIRCAGKNAKTVCKEDFEKNYLLSEDLLSSIAREHGEESGEYFLLLSHLAEEYSMSENTKRAIVLRQKYLYIVERNIGIQNDAWEANGKRQLRDLLSEHEFVKACVIGEKLSTMWDGDQDTYISEEVVDNKCEQMEMVAEALFGAGNPQKAITLCHRSLHYSSNKELNLKGLTQLSRYQYALNGTDSSMMLLDMSLMRFQSSSC